MPALIHLYETFSEALHAAQELEAAKIDPSTISLIVVSEKSEKTSPETNDAPKKDTSKGKCFAGLEIHNLEGLPPVAGCGWLVTTAQEKEKTGTKEAASGLTACLIENGLSAEYASTYVEGVKRGAALLGVQTSEASQATASRILREDHQPLDPRMRGRHYVAKKGGEDLEQAKASHRLTAMMISKLS